MGSHSLLQMAVERHNHMVTWKVLGDGPLGGKKIRGLTGNISSKSNERILPKEIVIICEMLAEILKIGGGKY